MNRQISRGKIKMYNRHEMVEIVKIDGKVLDRSSDTINKEIKTGEIEVSIKSFTILGSCKEYFF